MTVPNRYGGPPLKISNLTDARPWGMGTISGFYTVLDAVNTKADAFAAADVAVIRNFVRVFEDIYDNVEHLTHLHPCLSPLLVPLYHNSAEMTDRMRSMIVMWYTLVHKFLPPWPINGAAEITQLAFSSGSDIFLNAVVDNDPNSPIGIRYELAQSPNANKTQDLRFHEIHARGFGGTLFAALGYVHPQLPVPFVSHRNMGKALHKKPEGSHLVWRDNAASSEPFFSLVAPTAERAFEKHNARVCTRDYARELASNEVLRRFPRFVTHIIAHPVVFHDENFVTDFEVRLLQSHTKTALRGIAERYLQFAQVTLQTVRCMQQHNIRTPLNVDLLRPHETQYVYCGYALSGPKLGVTYFSGIDNNVSFDARSVHRGQGPPLRQPGRRAPADAARGRPRRRADVRRRETRRPLHHRGPLLVHRRRRARQARVL